MGSLSASFKTANAPYNIFNVISGAQTTGVTLKTGSKVSISPSRNYSRLQLTVDGVVSGIIYWTMDATVSATNLVGTPLPSGDNKEFSSNSGNRTISLQSIYFAPDTDDMVIHLDWS